MKKSGANASWNELPPAAREKLAGWLFDDRLNYRTALARARKEFGYKGSLSSLVRFHQRASRERRVITGFADALAQTKEIEGTEAGTDQLRKAGLKVMGQLFLRQVTEAPDEVRQWGWLAKLLLQSEENEIRQRTATEENERRREALKLARERFEFDVIEQAYRALPELKALERARSAKTRSRFASNRYMNELRRQLFGRAVEPLPENLQEELAMQAETTRANRKRDINYQQQWEEEEENERKEKEKREIERGERLPNRDSSETQESEDDESEDEESEEDESPDEEPPNENPPTP